MYMSFSMLPLTLCFTMGTRLVHSPFEHGFRHFILGQSMQISKFARVWNLDTYLCWTILPSLGDKLLGGPMLNDPKTQIYLGKDSYIYRQRRYQDYGVDGGEAAKSLAPKFDTISKHFTTHTGLQVPDFEIKLAVAAAIGFKTFGGIFFILGSSIGAILLLLHLAIVTPILYDFYNYDVDKAEFAQLFVKFTQNLALAGALLFFIGMKNSLPRRTLKRKTVVKAKTG